MTPLHAAHTEDEPPVLDAPRDLRPSLLIADDDPVVRLALASQLRDSFAIVGVAEDATQAIALAEEHRPDAALIDVDMPGGGARKAVPQIALRSPGTCMVILSADESRGGVLELLEGGAMAYVLKGGASAKIAGTLVDAIKAKAAYPQP